MRMAMIAITTKSSISVKPGREAIFRRRAMVSLLDRRWPGRRAVAIRASRVRPGASIPCLAVPAGEAAGTLGRARGSSIGESRYVRYTGPDRRLNRTVRAAGGGGRGESEPVKAPGEGGRAPWYPSAGAAASRVSCPACASPGLAPSWVGRDETPLRARQRLDTLHPRLRAR